MPLRHISFNSYEDGVELREELEKSSYKNLLLATNGRTYLLPDIAKAAETKENSSIIFITKNGANYSLYQVQELLKNKSPDVMNLVKNEPLGNALKNLNKNMQYDECPIEKNMMLFPTLASCGHSIGLVGMRKWLQTQKICPLCRKETPENKYARNLALQELNLSVFLQRQAIKTKKPKVIEFLKEELEAFKQRLTHFDNSLKETPELFDVIKKRWPHAVTRSADLLKTKLEKNIEKRDILIANEKSTRNRSIYIYIGLVAVTLVTSILLASCVGGMIAWLPVGLCVVASLSLLAYAVYKCKLRPTKIAQKVERDTVLLEVSEKNDLQSLRNEYKVIDRLHKRKNHKPISTANNGFFSKAEQTGTEDQPILKNNSLQCHPECEARRIS